MAKKIVKDELGERMKKFYENRNRAYLPRRTYTLLRIDGKCFHTFVKGLERPFDDGLMDDMNTAAAYICKNVMGADFAFVQSDEISILLTDFKELKSEAWFDNNVQKMTSVSASMTTRAFNEARLKRTGVSKMKWAEFDSRVFQIPPRIEVENYFIWRQQDATRNSISSVAQSLYKNHDDLKGVNSNAQQEMIFQKGINWNDYESKYKRGRIIVKKTFELPNGSIRTKWESTETPVFTQEREFLTKLIPINSK